MSIYNGTYKQDLFKEDKSTDFKLIPGNQQTVQLKSNENGVNLNIKNSIYQYRYHPDEDLNSVMTLNALYFTNHENNRFILTKLKNESISLFDH